jgi:DNA polymerase-3 subunit gamma/tau
MAYVSLYRKWRPQTFADVVGQDHVVGTLVNAVRSGQVHHALLFSGTRGTGKTSTARILAKALNCERGPTPEPCNACDACRAITDGTHLDVVEIDAASHGSVDDARDLRERATYTPASARYKVYIVDEAHMVTPQGFNAMLKVLEEPPEHVRFVFCTTEPHKVIDAIRSRCQQHDFRRVRTAVLTGHLARICAAEGVEIDQQALELIARAADGSVRDAQSRLDQVLTYAGAQVRLADVAQVLGALPVELRFDLAEALAGHRAADVFACVERVVQAGHDLQQFAREVLEHLRDLYVLRVAPDSPTLVDVTPETRERLVAQAARFGPGQLGRMLRLVGELYLDLRTATDQRLALEVGLAQAAMPETQLDAEALLARVERLERRLAIGADADAATGAAVPQAAVPHVAVPHVAVPQAAVPAAPPVLHPAAEGGRAAERQAAPESTRDATATPAPVEDGWGERPAAASAPLDLDLVRRSWALVVERVHQASRVAATYLEHGRPVALEGRTVLVEFPQESKFYAEALGKEGRSKRIDAALDAVLGGGLEARLVVGGPAAPGPGDVDPAAAPPGPAAAAPPPGLPDDDPAAGSEPDPERDEGRPLDPDADARAVADWAARELGGEIIEERPGGRSQPRPKDRGRERAPGRRRPA